MSLLEAAFLPQTLGAYAAVLAAFLSAGAAVIGILNKKHIQEIHVLVNSNLDEIKKKLESVTAERDFLKS